LETIIKSAKELAKELLEKLPDIGWAFLKILLVLLAIWLGYRIVKKIIVGFLHRLNANRAIPTSERKLNTLSNLVVLLLRVLFFFMALVAVFGILNLTSVLTSILATAGVSGLIIAIGSQSLVKDFIAGLLLTTEDQITLGDYVEVNGIAGTVEGLTLRTVQIRGGHGELHTIHAGSITKVTNYSRRDTLALADVILPGDTDITHAIAVITRIMNRWAAENKKILREPPHILGVTLQNNDSITIRVTCQVVPNAHWESEKEIRQLLKSQLEDMGLIPSPANEEKEL